jgi:hypothetical protein
MLSLLFLATPALSAPIAQVETIEERNEAGAWRKLFGPTTGAWVRHPDGQEEFLYPGMPIDAEDRIISEESRVRLQLLDDGLSLWEQITIYEESDLVLKDWGVVQDLGLILYQVRGEFTTQYGTVKGAVGGTRYVVSASAEGATLSVTRHTVALHQAPAEAPPGPPAPSDQLLLTLRRGESASWSDGTLPVRTTSGPPALPGRPPRASRSLGMLVGGGYSWRTGDRPDSPQVSWSVIGRRSIAGSVDLVATAGQTNTALHSRFPVSFGAEHTTGSLTLGADGQLLLGYTQDCDSGETALAVRSGASMSAGLRRPIGRLVVEGRLTAGWAYGPFINAALGSSYAF